MKHCNGPSLTMDQGHDVEGFFPGFLCPDCELLQKATQQQKVILSAHIEALRDNYLFDHPDVMRRAERDGGFGA